MPSLARRLTTTDAVVIGLASMIGAGIFSAFAPAAAAAGSGLLIGLLVAAVVAYANATSSAQLAVQYPTSGGTYVYGRQRLGPWWGYAAGWCFLIGKTASCAAMALTFASYAAPEPWRRPVAVLATVALVSVNWRGVTRTARLARIIVIGVLATLALLLGVTFASEWTAPSWTGEGLWGHGGVFGVLQAAGLLFFAFAGYARVATLGEEVREPTRTIPRAIQIALLITVLLYGGVALAVLGALGPERLAATDAPLAAAMELSLPVLTPVVRVAAAVASLGALLALIAGVSRTALAMAREGDLPRWFGAVHPRHQVPHHGELALGVVVCVLVLTLDLQTAIGFSSFGVLLYYLVANLAAWTQEREHRQFPRALQAVGVLGCIVLALALPAGAVLSGAAVLALGLLVRVIRRRRIRE